MKNMLLFVSTLDGKVTRWGEPHASLWSSHQDQDYLKRYGMNHDLLLWEAAHVMLRFLAPLQDTKMYNAEQQYIG